MASGATFLKARFDTSDRNYQHLRESHSIVSCLGSQACGCGIPIAPGILEIDREDLSVLEVCFQQRPGMKFVVLPSQSTEADMVSL